MAQILNIAALQTTLIWENPEANRALLQDKIKLVNEETDVLFLPEMFTSGFTMNASLVAESMKGDSIEWLKNLASEKNMAIGGSLVIVENGNFYNRFVFVTPNGSVEYYDKRHTFTLAGEHEVYASGEKKLIINYKDWKICPQICYDLRFPVWARNVEDYDVLVYVANWPKKRIKAWDVLLQARAIENMSYCMGVNRIALDGNGYEYTGHSAVYNPLGEELIHTKSDETIYATLHKNEIDTYRNGLKFLNDRDQFTVK
ncbi:MAG: amidohydrolase [Galbibacter orientalis]|uniref:amidohydrolase n=1 Tax=Galbibacter orientalis TaxID=453852 RepID=UPI0030012A5B